MEKRDISRLLRDFKLLPLTDKLRFYIERIKNRKVNRAFKKQNPTVKLPPDHLMYESFQINYKKYYTDSIDTSKWLIEYFERYINFENLKILDWGCGPARIIRHMPKLIENNCSFYGTDYNKKSINWCKRNIKDVEFSLNQLNPPLSYQNDYFDIIYGISIFTHLSKDLHKDWVNELIRITKKEGIIFLTTQGKSFRQKLTDAELKRFVKGELIVRGKVKEGHRTYSAFHPNEYMKKLFQNTEILEHVEGEIINNKPQQDIWIIKKK